MKKIGILGHFGFGVEKSNGQTIKTKTVTAELEKIYGGDAIGKEDTMGGWRFLMRLPAVVLHMLLNYQNIVILPAYKGVRLIAPLLALGNCLFRRRLHYVVIGGWLPGYIDKYPVLRAAMHAFHGIYVETHHMQQQITSRHKLENIFVMPNFKSLAIAGEDSLPDHEATPLKVCTFSRVMREKGIEDAILAVTGANQRLGRETYVLDIYGQVEKGQEPWFDSLMSRQPSTIRYGGVVPYAESPAVLSHYFALLFPTRFLTEGFAGTVIDAMAAGLPPIASDCPSNKELISEGVTGRLFPAGDSEALTAILTDIARQPQAFNAMRRNCLQEVKKYQPEEIIKTLTAQLL